MNYNAYMGVVRAIMPAFAGYLAGRGLISTGMANELGAALVTVLSAGWSITTNVERGK